MLTLDRRLFMQFLAFGACDDHTALIGRALAAAGLPGVLYEDLNDPSGSALLTFSEDPDFFLDRPASVPAPAALCELDAETGVHHAGAHLCPGPRG